MSVNKKKKRKGKKRKEKKKVLLKGVERKFDQSNHFQAQSHLELTKVTFVVQSHITTNFPRTLINSNEKMLFSQKASDCYIGFCS